MEPKEIIQLSLDSIKNGAQRTPNFEEKLFGKGSAFGNGILHDRIKALPEKEQFTFFWQSKSCFSQWHTCSFKGSVYSILDKELLPEIYREELHFSCAEQFMMYNKALLFGDIEMASKIMKTNNPRTQKAYGRKVRNFDEGIWKFARCEIVLLANRYKFSQNEDLKFQLFNTRGTTIVEASPYDKIWGIGMKENNPKAKDRKTWNGLNLLGEILTEIREEMILTN